MADAALPNPSLLPGLAPQAFAALLERLLAIADDAVIVADAAQRAVLFNEGAERMFGHPRAQVLGQPLTLLMPESARARHGAEVARFGASAPASRRMGERGRIPARRADGRLFHAEASISHVDLAGSTYYTAILRDVSEAHEQAQALERAKSDAEAGARAKSLFLANMSHEIRTPLNAVIGMTGLLLDTPMSDDQLDFARTIRASGQALLEIVNDILDYSKADVGKLEFEQQRFDLRRCVEDALDQVAPRAQEKGLNLAYLIEDGTPEALLGDASRVRQILVNLLANAVKFTHQGEVFVAVDSEPLAGPELRLHVAVHDSGIGIAPEHLGRLFQSFSQVDPSTTRKYGGTGLGLAISKRLAELMGGTVNVQSEAGKGSVFRVELVLSQAPDAAEPDFLKPDVPPLRGKRLLIVDDNRTNRRILTRLAMRWGMLPSTLPSALEALDRVRHGEQFDLALLDLRLPDQDATALAEAIGRRNGPGGVPIVMLSSMGQRLALPAAQRAGWAAVLCKPIKAGELFNTLVRVLQGQGGAPAPVAPPSVRPAVPTHRLADRLPLRVLVAEDNGVNQQVALRLLEHLGYRADLAANGLEVIEAVERQTYDLVLMDIQMPEMDGLQAARWIVPRRGPSGLPRLVATTANALPGDRERFVAAGFDAYLSKPITADSLAAVLDRAAPQRPAAPARDAPEGDPLLDAARLEHLRTMQGDSQPTLVRDLIDMFSVDSALHLRHLADAQAQGQFSQVRTLAHRLLSATQNIGARRLSTLCLAIEGAAREARHDDVDRLLLEMAEERDRVQAALAVVRPQY